MELGNMMFGYSTEGIAIPDRSIWQDLFCSKMDLINIDGYGCHWINENKEEYGFENSIFKVTPYYWGDADCLCGFEEKLDDFIENNKDKKDFDSLYLDFIKNNYHLEECPLGGYCYYGN